MLKPKKISVRSDQEIAAVMIAYRNLFKTDPFLANMMLLCSELSEYNPIDLIDWEKMKVFIEENRDALVMQFLKRFKSIDEYAIPLESTDSPDDTGTNSGALNEDKITFLPGCFTGPAGGIGKA